MNREYLRMRLSENSDRPLAGVYGAARPLSHGLSCVRFPFHLPANSAIQPSRKGLFAFLVRTPGDTKGLHGLRGRKHTSRGTAGVHAACLGARGGMTSLRVEAAKSWGLRAAGRDWNPHHVQLGSPPERIGDCGAKAEALSTLLRGIFPNES